MKHWEEFLTAQEKDLGPEAIDQWLRPLRVVHFDAGNLYLEASDAFQLAWFEEHMRAKVRKFFLNNNHRPIKVHLSSIEPPKKSKKSTGWKPSLDLSQDSLDPKQTFETFLQNIPSVTENLDLGTQGNVHLFQEALQSAAFNPIYLHGPSGSGKTHLLMAAANFLKTKGLSCFYVRAETLTEHVVAAIRNGAMQKFRELYRNHDVLIIDDIDIISGRTATQEEFFHTFNALHTSGRQIILSANTPPSGLKEIEPRLTSRFEWGLVLPLHKLDSKQLKQLLLSRIEEHQFPLHESVCAFLLSHFSSPKSLVRSLDALILRAHLDHLTPKQIDTSKATFFLTKLLEEEKKNLLTPDKIIQAVAQTYGIKPSDILGKSQTQECTLPRQIAIYLCRTRLKMSFLKIASFFSRDHSTIMTSVKAIEKKSDELKPYLQEIERRC